MSTTTVVAAAPLPVDTGLYDALAVTLELVLAFYLVAGLARLAARKGVSGLALPLACALGVRAAIAIIVDGVPALAGTRGIDEIFFARQGRQLAAGTASLGEVPAALLGNLHIWWMALQGKLIGASGDLYLRVGHAALAVAGIAVLAVTVGQLAGAARGRLAAWLLAFEPSSAFFSTILHKEAPMFLGEALVVAGCVRMYTRRDGWSVAIMVAGLGVAAGARPYAAAAMAVACGLTLAHAGLRRMGHGGVRRPVLAAIVVVVALTGLAVGPSISTVLGSIQRAQNANASNQQANLPLPPVNYTNVTSVVTNLPGRAFDVLSRPLPWEAANTSQQLGVIGTVVAWTLIAAVMFLFVRRPKLALEHLVPVAYILGSLLLVYSLSTGNAGTGFRYRSHLVVLLIITLAVVAPRGVGTWRPARSGSQRLPTAVR